MGVYMDESQLRPEMTVRRLEVLVEEGSRNPLVMSFPGWGVQWWCRILRGFLQRAVIFPLVSHPYGLKVVGRENLEGITGPVIFASNHNLGLDTRGPLTSSSASTIKSLISSADSPGTEPRSPP